MRLASLLVIASSLSILAGCAAVDTRGTREPAPATKTTAKKPGGYYLDDGPGDNIPTNLAEIPDAVPKAEPPHRGANRPYTALGKDYVPMPSARGFRQNGLASWYGRRYHGKPTSSGEAYDMYAMSAAHPTLPIPSYVRVSNPANGRSVVVRVNDRGPFHDGRVIDLSYTAAWKLDILKGVTPVTVEAIDPLAPASDPPVVAQAQPPATAAPTAEGTIYLQLGAFSNAEGADAFVQRVRSYMGIALPDVQPLRSADLYKIQAGPFASVALAEQAADAVRRQLGIQAFRVSR